MKQEELNEILDKHSKWLRGEGGGERADLRYANLRYADLRYANLRSADLRSANLRYANLENANLENADLRSADLRSANLENANLRSANLRYADLRSAKNGEEEIKKCNTILGLNYNILMFQNIVTVGCQKHELSRWIDFNEQEVKEMADDALEFYPLLIQILKHEYKNTPWAF